MLATKSVDVSASVITLHRATLADEPFLYQTYSSTRAEEMALTGWNDSQKEAFLRMQYEAQRRSYSLQVPDAEYCVIRRDGVAAGRLIVHRTVQHIQVVDIALLPQFRHLGVGSTLMTAIMQEASRHGKSVGLHVERFNPALHWYARLGFSIVSQGPVYLEMVWRPVPARQGREEHNRPENQSEVGVAYVNLPD